MKMMHKSKFDRNRCMVAIASNQLAGTFFIWFHYFLCEFQKKTFNFVPMNSGRGFNFWHHVKLTLTDQFHSVVFFFYARKTSSDCVSIRTAFSHNDFEICIAFRFRILNLIISPGQWYRFISVCITHLFRCLFPYFGCHESSHVPCNRQFLLLMIKYTLHMPIAHVQRTDAYVFIKYNLMHRISFRYYEVASW